MLGAEIEHFLGLRYAADQRTAKLRRLKMRLKTGTASGCSGAPTWTSVPSRFQEVEILADVMRRSDRVEDEVEAACMHNHLLGILRDHDLVGASLLPSLILPGEVVNRTVRAPNS